MQLQASHSRSQAQPNISQLGTTEIFASLLFDNVGPTTRRKNATVPIVQRNRNDGCNNVQRLVAVIHARESKMMGELRLQIELLCVNRV